MLLEKILYYIKRKAEFYQRLYELTVEEGLPHYMKLRAFNRADVLFELIEDIKEMEDEE